MNLFSLSGYLDLFLQLKNALTIWSKIMETFWQVALMGIIGLGLAGLWYVGEVMIKDHKN